MFSCLSPNAEFPEEAEGGDGSTVRDRSRKPSVIRQISMKVYDKLRRSKSPNPANPDGGTEPDDDLENIMGDFFKEFGHGNESQEGEEPGDPAKRFDTGMELAQELRTAFDLYSKGLESIPCKEIGYILRTLGQNPTEDEILNIVCEAGCDWEGSLSREDFLNVSHGMIQKQINRVDDVKAAFRAFDHNGDGSISKDELKDAMVRFGQTFSQDEAEEMFREADLNRDGKIDWEEFLEMMLPGHKHLKDADEKPAQS